MRFHPYRCESAYPETDAERNLHGRTHYAEPDTRRWFKSRFIMAGHECGGMLYWIVESMPMRHRDDKRGFRYRIFDLCGNVIDGKSIDDPDCFHRTSKAAYAAMREALKAIDAPAVTRTALYAHAEWTARQVESARKWVDEQERAMTATAAGE